MRDKKTFAIIGAAMEVHKELGNGFLETVYQEALEQEFTYQEIPYKSQPPVRIEYKGKPLKKTYEPDFICFNEVIVGGSVTLSPAVTAWHFSTLIKTSKRVFIALL